MRRRTKARMLALLFIYQEDFQGERCLEDLEDFLETFNRDKSVRRYAHLLISGCIENREKIDTEIKTVSANWQINRMAPVDRSIIRLAAYEMIFHKETPPKVVINEAIELAKKFSTPESGSFVNGLLDKIRERNNIAITKS